MSDKMDNTQGKRGQVVAGKYMLVGEGPLGKGGQGEVWKAQRMLKGVPEEAWLPCAVKLYDQHRLYDAYLTEVRALAELSEAGLPQILDVAKDGDLVYIAMEFLDGETLRQRLDRTPSGLPWRRALYIAREVAATLDQIHAKQYSHRDVKPQNIMLAAATPGRPAGRVCLIDFGIALRVSTAKRQGTGAAEAPPVKVEPVQDGVTPPLPGPLRKAGELQPVVAAGTPPYAAPESYHLSADRLTTAADAYSLGAVLYEMLVGQPPPQATTDDVRLPSSLSEKLPRSVVALVHRLLRFDADRRPQALKKVFDAAYERPYGAPERPFPGYQPFGYERAGYLFGRDAELRAISELLLKHRGIVLSGPPRCGKTSLASAGVAARLSEDLALGCDGWKLVCLTPGKSPAPDIPQPAAAAAANVGGPGAGGVGTLVIVDQVEEMLTLATEESRRWREGLAALLGGHVAVRLLDETLDLTKPVRIVMTVREAALPRLREFPALTDLLTELIEIRDIDRSQIERWVVAPLPDECTVESEALRRVRAEAYSLLKHHPEALPAVQRALERWWEVRSPEGRLTTATWLSVGKVSADAAEEVYSHSIRDPALRDEAREMKRLFLALFDPIDRTRRRLPVADLTQEQQVLVERFAALGLLREYRGDIEVMHDRIPDLWPRLERWLWLAGWRSRVWRVTTYVVAAGLCGVLIFLFGQANERRRQQDKILEEQTAQISEKTDQISDRDRQVLAANAQKEALEKGLPTKQAESFAEGKVEGQLEKDRHFRRLLIQEFSPLLSDAEAKDHQEALKHHLSPPQALKKSLEMQRTSLINAAVAAAGQLEGTPTAVKDAIKVAIEQTRSSARRDEASTIANAVAKIARGAYPDLTADQNPVELETKELAGRPKADKAVTLVADAKRAIEKQAKEEKKRAEDAEGEKKKADERAAAEKKAREALTEGLISAVSADDRQSQTIRRAQSQEEIKDLVAAILNSRFEQGKNACPTPPPCAACPATAPANPPAAAGP